MALIMLVAKMFSGSSMAKDSIRERREGQRKISESRRQKEGRIHVGGYMGIECEPGRGIFKRSYFLLAHLECGGCDADQLFSLIIKNGSIV